MKFALAQAVLMQQKSTACLGPVEETIAGWGQYSSHLTAPQQLSIDKLADLIVSSFTQRDCPPFRTVDVAGHADKDWQGVKVEEKVSFDRAMTVQKALTETVKKLWSDRNMGPPPVGGVDWDAHGEGAKKMIAPAFHSANRRAVVTLVRSGAPIALPAEKDLISPRGTPLNPKKFAKMINIFGERETEPGFVNYTTDPRYAVGGDGVKRPWTHDSQIPPGLANNSASDICIRSSPLSKLTLDEIERIAKPGTRVTIALNSDPKTDGLPGSTDEQLQRFRDKFPKRVTLFDGVHHGTFEGNQAATDWKAIVVDLP